MTSLGLGQNPMERFRYKHCKSEPEILIPDKQDSWTRWTLLMGDWLSEFIRMGWDTDVGWIYRNSLGVLDSGSDM